MDIEWSKEMGRELSNSLNSFPSELLESAFENLEQMFSNCISHSSTEQEASDCCQERPTKQLRHTDSWKSSSTIEHISIPEESSGLNIFLVGDSDSPTAPTQLFHGSSSGGSSEENAISPQNNSSGSDIKTSEVVNRKKNKKASSSSSKPPSCSQDHILAERKRRAKLTERFIALSALVPGLKKMDKASVLGDATKYLKQLQERVKTLEEQTSDKTIRCSDEAHPEIEARVSNRNVLVRVHCEKHKGILVRVFSEMEKLNLSVVNSSVIPFGASSLDITIVAQMNKEFDMTVKELVKNLRSGLLQFL